MERSPRALLATPLAALLSFSLLSAQELRDPLLGKVLAPDGTPVAGATVEVWRAGGSGTYLLDTAYRSTHRRIAVARTAVDGAFAAHTPLGLPCRVVVDHAPFARFVVDDVLPGTDLTIRLQPPAALRIAAQLAGGGGTRCGVRIHPAGAGEELLRAWTDEHGLLRCERLPPGDVQVQLYPEGARLPTRQVVALSANAVTEWSHELDPGATLSGRVTDEQGAPIAGARVGEGWEQHRAVTTDADGRYQLRGFGGANLRQVRCSADGFVTVDRDYPEDREHDQSIDFAMQRGERATGRVLDGERRPLAGVYLQAFTIDPTTPRDAIGLVTTHTDASGAFTLAGMRPSTPHALVVRRDGYGMRVYQLPIAARGALHVGEIVLEPTRELRGTLCDASGEPLADALIELHGYNADRYRLCPDTTADERVLPDPGASFDMWGMIVGRRCIRTDAAGRFAFGDVADGSHLLIARSGRHELCQHGPFDVTAEPLPPVQLRYR